MNRITFCRLLVAFLLLFAVHQVRRARREGAGQVRGKVEVVGHESSKTAVSGHLRSLTDSPADTIIKVNAAIVN